MVFNVLLLFFLYFVTIGRRQQCSHLILVLFFFSEVDRSIFQKKLKSLLKSHHSYPEVMKMSAIYQNILSYGFKQLLHVVIILVCRL